MNICCQTTRAGGLWAVAVGTDIQRSSFVYMTNSICQRLYDSEINFTISCFWDDGFVVMLGDSSIWGYLLQADQTQAACLNQLNLTTPSGRKVPANA